MVRDETLSRLDHVRLLEEWPSRGPVHYFPREDGYGRNGPRLEFTGPPCWIGQFAGHSGLDVIVAAPGGKYVLVLSGGTGYWVDVADPGATRIVVEGIEHVVVSAASQTISVADRLRVTSFGEGGVRWTSPRVSYDGIRNLRAEGQARIDLVTGAVSGFSVPVV